MLGPARAHATLVWSLSGAAIALGTWNLALITAARLKGRNLTIEVVARAQHYLQACEQTGLVQKDTADVWAHN